ncbi:hypothetical protein ACFYWN_28520 [Streptomyces sp. NPDC002917]|uniref:hypothetical protein n=1 Tax=unclassified Streptomyces TaxID=2593676 RepID=UPI0033B8EE5A
MRGRSTVTPRELTRAQKEIFTQRQRIGELMGRLRDFEQMVPGESVQRLTTENTSLKHRVQQLTHSGWSPLSVVGITAVQERWSVPTGNPGHTGV